jgi:hypothetical protein
MPDYSSLNLLRQNLGDIGQGVVNYIQRTRENEKQKQQVEALKQYHSSLLPQAQQFGVELPSPEMGFMLGGMDAGNAAQMMQSTLERGRPTTSIVGNQRGGQRAVTTFPSRPGQVELGQEVTPGFTPMSERPIGEIPIEHMNENQLIMTSTNPNETPERVETAKRFIEEKQRVATARSGRVSPEDIEPLANSIIAGEFPPDLTHVSSFRDRTTVANALAKKGFSYKKEHNEYKNAQKLASTMNSNQQVAWRQAIVGAEDDMDAIERAALKLRRFPIMTTKYKLWNSAALEAAVQLGGNVGEAAQEMISTIAKAQGDIAGAMARGFAPHDADKQAAAKMLGANWSPQVLDNTIRVTRQFLANRKHAIDSTQPLFYNQDAGRLQQIGREGTATTPDAQPAPAPQNTDEQNRAEAMQWLKDNPNHPNAAKVRQRLETR